jgi:hypothetical protein
MPTPRGQPSGSGMPAAYVLQHVGSFTNDIRATYK